MGFIARINQFATRKVPAVLLLVMLSVGLVAGAIAATMVVSQVTRSGEGGTYHNNTGAITVTDNGLGVVSNSATAVPTATFPGSGNTNANNALTAGHWFDAVVFNNTATDSGSHTATISVHDGAGVTGTLIVSASFTLTGGGATVGTITAYVDLGSATLTSPVTVYVSIT